MKIHEKPAQYLLHQFCEGYKTRDLALLLSLFTHNAQMWGSAIDEYRNGIQEIKEQILRDWSQSDQGEIRIIELSPQPASGNWVAAKCTAFLVIDGKEYVFEHLRGTVVAELVGSDWKIAHMHCSFPDIRNAENSSFPCA